MDEVEGTVTDVPTGLWPFAHEAAIFDFDGTIADSDEAWSEVDHIFLESRGIEWTPDLGAELAVRGFSKGAEYVIERYGLSETPEEICREWDEMGRVFYPRLVRLREGAAAYIKALRDVGVPVALATTSNRQIIGSLMPRIDVEAMFDVVVYGTDVARDKNHPDIYLETAARLGVDPTGCLVFEDIVPALLSAKRAGMTTCALAPESGNPRCDLRESADLFLAGWEGILPS